jgi:hypothetical protein
VRFEVLTAVNGNTFVAWDVTATKIYEKLAALSGGKSTRLHRFTFQKTLTLEMKCIF